MFFFSDVSRAMRQFCFSGVTTSNINYRLLYHAAKVACLDHTASIEIKFYLVDKLSRSWNETYKSNNFNSIRLTLYWTFKNKTKIGFRNCTAVYLLWSTRQEVVVNQTIQHISKRWVFFWILFSFKNLLTQFSMQ